MPLTGPVTYFWVGGATGTTSASRFDWNVAENWRVKISTIQPISEYNLKTPTIWPAGGDTVRLGYGNEWVPGTTSTHKINSPLLFGGFSGSGGTGCWICSGQTGSGLSGASGTTFDTVLLNFIVDEYPFGTIGGGLTGNQLFGPADYYLPFMNVSNMDRNAWAALGGSASSRQQNLSLKVYNINYIKLSKDKTGYFTIFAPNIIDSYSTLGVSGSTGYIQTSIYFSAVADTSYSSPNLFLNGAKVYEITKLPPSGGTGSLSSYTEPLSIYAVNSKIGFINSVAAGYINTDADCVIGKLNLTAANYATITDSQTLTLALGGTYRYYNALRALGLPGATLDASDAEINIQIKQPVGWGNWANLSVNLGGQTAGAGATGVFVANRVNVEFAPYNPGSTAQAPITIGSRATIGEMVISGGELKSAAPLTNNSGSIDITTLRLKDNATLNFRENPVFDNWRLGVAQASASGLTLIGGLVFESPTSSVKGDPGMRFINYGRAASIDIRNSRPLSISDTAVPPAEAL